MRMAHFYAASSCTTRHASCSPPTPVSNGSIPILRAFGLHCSWTSAWRTRDRLGSPPQDPKGNGIPVHGSREMPRETHYHCPREKHPTSSGESKRKPPNPSRPTPLVAAEGPASRSAHSTTGPIRQPASRRQFRTEVHPRRFFRVPGSSHCRELRLASPTTLGLKIQQPGPRSEQGSRRSTWRRQSSSAAGSMLLMDSGRGQCWLDHVSGGLRIPPAG